ncbi:MAG TPA: caspase family protein [Anaeromyxobacteraceae bacterium]|nr:caspase family protein [Anaeromyxobacteraceae bacterium]
MALAPTNLSLNARCSAWAALLLALACASSGEKGGLVPLDVPRAALDAGYAPRRLALVIGIRQFEEAGWNTLRYSEKDADDLAAVLRDPALGHFDQVEVLKGGPTRAEVQAALSRLALSSQDDRDTVLVYLSTHGTLARDARGDLRRYLVTRETRVSDVPGTALSVDGLLAEFDALKSRRKVLILAACHSGGGKSRLPDAVERERSTLKGGFFVRPIEEVSRSSVVLAASDWGETAREDEKLENDIYTHFFVEALRQRADRNGDGAVTVSEAHDYARRMTYEFTLGRQRPSAETSEVGVDPIVLVGAIVRRGKPELYSYDPRLDGFTVRVDGLALAELPGGVAVDPGRHRVEIAKGEAEPAIEDAVVLAPGERLDLERLATRSLGRFEFEPRIAVMGFLDRQSRADVLGPVVGAGVSVTSRDFPSPHLNLRIDAEGSVGSGSLTEGTPAGPAVASYRYSAFTAGVALPWRFTPLGNDRLQLLGGPRLSLVYLQRSFSLDLVPAQSYLTLTPGLMGGLELAFGRFSVGAEAQLDFMLLKVNGANRSSGFGELSLGAGWRF